MLDKARQVLAFPAWLYFQYVIVLSLNMLEPWERRLLNTILVAFLSVFLLMMYTTCTTFVPVHLNQWTGLAKGLLGYDHVRDDVTGI